MSFYINNPVAAGLDPGFFPPYKNFHDYITQFKCLSQARKVPNISVATAGIITQLLVKHQAKNILEVGCANGYSTLHWAHYTQTCAGHVHAIELSAPMVAEAMAHLHACKLQNYASVHWANALHHLPQLKPNQFDAVFIDAQKKYTAQFLQNAVPLLKAGGMVVIDDVIRFAEQMVPALAWVEQHAGSYSIIPVDGDDGILYAVF